MRRATLNYLIVFLGAGFGGALRHGVNLATAAPLRQQFPYGTLVINVLGSLLMGIIAEYFSIKGHLPQQWRLFLTTGVLGGFTTFSAFSLETALLLERGRLELTALYVAGSVFASILALFAGLALVRGFPETLL
jgi:CrcB protein